MMCDGEDMYGRHRAPGTNWRSLFRRGTRRVSIGVNSVWSILARIQAETLGIERSYAWIG